MKRNLDLIRMILLSIESSDSSRLYIEDLNLLANYTHDEIAYQIRLLMDAEYIDACERGQIGTLRKSYTIYRLTNSGHDYLDSVRDETIWINTKKKLGSAFVSASFELVKAVSFDFVKKSLGL